MSLQKMPWAMPYQLFILNFLYLFEWKSSWTRQKPWKKKIKINKKAQQLSNDTEIKVNTQFLLHYHRPSSISCLHKRLIKHRVPNYLWILSSSPLIRFYSTIVDMDDGNNEKKLILLRIDNGNGNNDVDYFHLAINFNHIFFNATHRFNNNKKKVVVEHIVGAGHRAFN